MLSVTFSSVTLFDEVCDESLFSGALTAWMTNGSFAAVARSRHAAPHDQAVTESGAITRPKRMHRGCRGRPGTRGGGRSLRSPDCNGTLAAARPAQTIEKQNVLRGPDALDPAAAPDEQSAARGDRPVLVRTRDPVTGRIGAGVSAAPRRDGVLSAWIASSSSLSPTDSTSSCSAPLHNPCGQLHWLRLRATDWARLLWRACRPI